MQVKDFNAICDIPIGSYCFCISNFVPNTFAEERKYIDNHSDEYYDNSKRYIKIVDASCDSILKYESYKLIGIKDNCFCVESMDEERYEHINIFLSRDEMETFWEQHMLLWQKDKEDAIQYIKTKYPKVSELAREQISEDIEAHRRGSYWWDESEVQAEINKY